MTALNTTAGGADAAPVDARPNDRPTSRLTLSAGLGLMLSFLTFLVHARISGDNSLMTHVSTGRLILADLSVPSTDPYSYTAAGTEWTVQSWFPSVVYASLERWVGLGGVRLIHALLAFCIALGLWRLSRPAEQLIARIGLVALPLGLGGGVWSHRPLMFGLLAMVVALLILQDVLPLWVAIPLMWVWANSHGSFPMAFALVGAALVGAAIDLRRIPMREVRVLAAFVIGTGVAMINPIGPRLLWFPLQLLNRGEVLQNVREWMSPSFRTPVEWVFLAMIAVVLVAAKRQAGWRELLPCLGFMIGGLLAVRNLAVASLVMSALLAPSFARVFGTLDGKRSGVLARGLATVSVASTIIFAAVVMQSEGISTEQYPVDEISYLEERGLVANDTVRILHREYVGNYLEFRFGRSANVFFDDRFDMYPIDQIETHAKLITGTGNLVDIIDELQVDVAVWVAEEPVGVWLASDPDWDIVIDGETWIVACNRTSVLYESCRAAS